MPYLRDIRNCILLANGMDMIDDEETILLYDLSTSDNLDIPYWTYNEFQLDCLSDDECRGEFRFAKNDIYRLCDALGLPDEITFYNGNVSFLWAPA